MKLLYSSYVKEPGQQVNFVGEEKGEKILLVLRRHPITNLRWLLLSLLLFSAPMFLDSIPVGSVPPTYLFVGLTFWYIFSFGYFFTSFLIWFYSVYIVSNKRVVDIDFHGFTSRTFSEALLTNIEDLTHHIRGAAQVIFHYGTVDIQTAGESREIEFEDVPQPAEVQDFISDLTVNLHHHHHGGVHENA